jgi:hypothetical protein
MKSLQQLLAKQSEQELEQFAAPWAITDAPHDGWIHHRSNFLQRFDNVIAARFAWERLSPDERVLLYNILGPHGHNWIEREELAKKMRAHLPRERFEETLASLKAHLYVLEEVAKMQGDQLVDSRYGYYSYGYGKNRKLPVRDVSILYVPQELAGNFYLVGNEIFAYQGDPATLTLEQVLAHMPQNLLNTVGSNFGWIPTYGTSQSIAKGLAELLLQPARLSYALGRLQMEPSVQEALQWLYEQGGRASMQALRQRFNTLNEARISTLLHRLAAYALAFDLFAGQQRVVFIPVDIYKRLHDAHSQSRTDIPIGLVALAEPPTLTFVGDSLTYNDVATLIGIIYQQNIEPTKSGTVPKRIANKLLPLLKGRERSQYAGEDNRYLEMLLYEMRRMGLVEFMKPSLPEGKQRYAPGPELEEWASMDALAQTRLLLSCWLSDHNWFDAPGVNYKPSYMLYTTTFAARGPLLGYLKNCTPGTWYTVKSLLDTIHGTDPFLLHPQERGSFFRDKRRMQELEEHWNERDGELLIGMLASSLYELGIVAPGYQDSTGTKTPRNPDYFMLTEMGAILLGELNPQEQLPVPTRANMMSLPNEFGDELEEFVPAPVPVKVGMKPRAKKQAETAVDRPRSLIVQPTFELLIMQPDLPTLYSLLPFAQLNSPGNVSRLTLTRDSILRGLEWRLTIDEMLQTLESHSQKPIPQNVDYTLRDWAKAYRAVEISQVLLLTVESEAHADGLLASSRLKEFNLRRLGPTALAASNEVNVQNLQRALEKEGIAVHFSGTIAPLPAPAPVPIRSKYYGRY